MDKCMKAVLVSLVGFYLIVVVGLDYGSSNLDESYKIENERLKELNNELTLQNDSLDEQLENLTLSDAAFSDLINDNKVERILIKEQIDETINNIDSSDNNELYSFFTNFKTDGFND